VSPRLTLEALKRQEGGRAPHIALKTMIIHLIPPFKLLMDQEHYVWRHKTNGGCESELS
jgi:hypothetical protein